MKCPRKDKVVICRELVQARVEFPLVDETTGFIDDYERVDRPMI